MTEYGGDLLELGDDADALYLSPGQWVADGDVGDLGGFDAGYLPPYVQFSIDDADLYRWNASVATWYSLIWIVIGPRMPWVPLTMPFTLGGDTTLGSTATPDEIRAVKRQVLKYKSPHAYPVKVILAFEGVVLLGRQGLTMPFVQHAPPIPYCTWAIGKTMNDTLHSMPFVQGGYQIDAAA